MLLSEWLESEFQRLKRFQTYYLQERKYEPDLFPIKMNEGEWDEQYRAYDE